MILDGRTADADAMVSKLSKFLRMGLAVDPSERIPLSLEIALQRTYLDIERLRYPDLDVMITIPAELETALVPSLILQPIVENAVKYGLSASPLPIQIAIAVTESQGQLLIEVTDDGTANGGQSKGTGIGLRHVRKRLHLLYGDQGSLTHGRIASAGYKVQLTLPLERT